MSKWLSIWLCESNERVSGWMSKQIMETINQGPNSILRPSYLRMAISMLKIRRPLGRLIFNIGIAIPGKTVFLIETAPRARIQY